MEQTLKEHLAKARAIRWARMTKEQKSEYGRKMQRARQNKRENGKNQNEGENGKIG